MEIVNTLSFIVAEDYVNSEKVLETFAEYFFRMINLYSAKFIHGILTLVKKCLSSIRRKQFHREILELILNMVLSKVKTFDQCNLEI